MATKRRTTKPVSVEKRPGFLTRATVFALTATVVAIIFLGLGAVIKLLVGFLLS